MILLQLQINHKLVHTKQTLPNPYPNTFRLGQKQVYCFHEAHL